MNDDDNDDDAYEKKRKTGRSGLVSLPRSAAQGFLALIINHRDDDDDDGVYDDSG